MKKILWLAGVTVAAAAMAGAQTSPQQMQSGQATSAAKPQGDTANQRANAPAIPVTLDKSVDSKKAKAGDEIVAKTAVSMSNAQGTQIPQGTRVIGHIMDAKAKSKGDTQSSLTFSFEKIVLKNGQEIPFHAIATAMGEPQSNAAMAEANGSMMQPPSGGGAGGTGSAQPGAPTMGGGGQTGAPAGAAPMAGGGGAGPNVGASAGALPANASGAVGMKGVTLDAQANSSVVSSDSKSMKLESGTQMLLRVVSQ